MTKPLHAEYTSLHDLAQAVQKKQVLPTELANSAIKYCLDKQSYNIFNQIAPELSANQAQEIETKLLNQASNSIFGALIAHEDRLVTKNWCTTASSKMLSNYVSPFNASAVEQLNNQATICIGKTNCDEFGLGTSGANSKNGYALNPWNKDHSAGGSSSAAAVAAKFAMAATAIDTIGNARISSSWCGVSALKPTYGIVSRYGIVASGSSLEAISVIANNALDLLGVLNPISGFDTQDSTSLQECNQILNNNQRIEKDFEKHNSGFADNDKPLSGLKIGITQELNSTADNNVKNAVDAAIKKLAELGADIIPVTIEHADIASNTAFLLHNAEAATELSRYDGVHFGYRAEEYTDINDLITKSRTQGLGQETKDRIMFGNYVLSHQQYDKFYLQAQRIRSVISDNLQSAFKECDVIISPTTLTTASPISLPSSFNNDIKNSYYTAIANLSGVPAISIPVGIDQNLPIGMQIMGNHFDEGLLIAIANVFQNATQWHQHNLELK